LQSPRSSGLRTQPWVRSPEGDSSKGMPMAQHWVFGIFALSQDFALPKASTCG